MRKLLAQWDLADWTVAAFLALFAFCMLMAVILTFTGPVWAHSWYDNACCNISDCRQTTLGEVERRADGWFVVPTGETIGFDDKRIKHSMDALVHRCLFKDALQHNWVDGVDLGPVKAGDTRCLYVPDVPV